jgi:hypothetical protein
LLGQILNYPPTYLDRCRFQIPKREKNTSPKEIHWRGSSSFMRCDKRTWLLKVCLTQASQRSLLNIFESNQLIKQLPFIFETMFNSCLIGCLVLTQNSHAYLCMRVRPHTKSLSIYLGCVRNCDFVEK